VKAPTYENFPWPVVAVCNAVGWCIYGLGLYLMARLGLVYGLIYGLYCVWMELRLLRGSCRRCYYYGKRCGFGRGILCSWFFARQPAEGLAGKQVTWRDLAPDFLVSLFPLAAGIAWLIGDFSWLALALVVLLVFLSSAGTGFVRERLACLHCKQREIGCPAQKLFAKPEQA
jgi:hypothetical protein